MRGLWFSKDRLRFSVLQSQCSHKFVVSWCILIHEGTLLDWLISSSLFSIPDINFLFFPCCLFFLLLLVGRGGGYLCAFLFCFAVRVCLLQFSILFRTLPVSSSRYHGIISAIGHAASRICPLVRLQCSVGSSILFVFSVFQWWRVRVEAFLLRTLWWPNKNNNLVRGLVISTYVWLDFDFVRTTDCTSCSICSKVLLVSK